MAVNPEAVSVICSNAEMVDKSVVEFIEKCMGSVHYSMFHPEEATDMASALAKILAKALGSWSNVVGAIVNDEGYGKWSTFDSFQKKCTPSAIGHIPGVSLMFGCIYNDLGCLYDRKNSTDLQNDFISCIPEVDYTINSNFYAKAKASFLPATVSVGMFGGYPRSITTRKSMPKDYYCGLIVSKDTYPDADSAALNQPHCAIRTKGDGEIRNGNLTLDSFDYGGHGFDWMKDVTDNITNPGLIYVPAKDLYKILKGVPKGYGTGDGTTYRTVLPRDILEKYGLPTMEIRG